MHAFEMQEMSLEDMHASGTDARPKLVGLVQRMKKKLGVYFPPKVEPRLHLRPS